MRLFSQNLVLCFHLGNSALSSVRDGGNSRRDGSGAGRYTLRPTRLSNEDILFCIDVDPESMVEMKAAMSPNGRPFNPLGLDQASHTCLHQRQAHHQPRAPIRLCLSRKIRVLGIELLEAMIMALGHSFELEGKSLAVKSILLLLHFESSVRPNHQWPVNQKLFTLDVVYLHDKPGPDNCPQEVYDSLVDALELVSEYEGYILESGQGLTRVLFRYMCMLLSHPQQRCPQDHLDIPKPLLEKSCRQQTRDY
ncbi:hypothetical protein GBA52_028676 [Prunus armeniaca]|nr:hypothetical protein GBA52_028676 [Prunus armeniaca]